jgi:hypothetical protein
VTTSSIIFAPNSLLLIGCVVSVITLAILGFRLRNRSRLRIPEALHSLETNQDLSVQRIAAKPGHRTQEVIRLPSAPGPVSTAEMTQQEKIAAALQKAGISNPAWAAPSKTEPPDSRTVEPENEN